MYGVNVVSDKGLLRLSNEIYPLSVIYKTAYLFLNRYYVLLDQDTDGHVIVSLTSKQSGGLPFSDTLAGEFCNELLNQAVRYDVYQKTKNVRELILARALYSTSYVKEELNEAIEPDGKSFELNSIARDWFSDHDA